MMNGYSKISTAAHKSRSMDFSYFSQSVPQTPKPSISTAIPEPEGDEEPYNHNPQVKNAKTHQQGQHQKKNNSSPPETEREREREDVNEGGNIGEIRFGVVLGRSGSVSSASGFQATVKRAFSMRRSSSVSERYCRIHDQYMAIASPIGGDDEMDADGIGTIRSLKKKNNKKKLLRGSKIFKACKRLLGLQL